MYAYDKISGLGIIWSVISRLGEDMKAGSISACRELAKFAHDLSGVSEQDVASVKLHDTEFAEGFSIGLIDRRRVVVMLGAEVEPGTFNIKHGRLPVGQSSVNSDMYLAFIEDENTEHDVFNGAQPKFMYESSLVTGRLPEVMGAIKNCF